MANKKKKKHALQTDVRGYGQHVPSSTTTTTTAAVVQVTTTTQQQLHAVAQSFATGGVLSTISTNHDTTNKDGSSVTSTSNTNTSCSSLAAGAIASPERFAKRLGVIYDKLVDVSFTEHQVEQVVVALQYSITFESALDWLCGNLSTRDLPPLFTEGVVRDAAALSSASSSSSKNHPLLQVIRPQPQPVFSVTVPGLNPESTTTTTTVATAVISTFSPSPPPQPRPANTLANHHSSNTNTDQQQEMSASRLWILEHYQYEEEGDDDEKASFRVEKEVEKVEEDDAPYSPLLECTRDDSTVTLAGTSMDHDNDTADHETSEEHHASASMARTNSLLSTIALPHIPIIEKNIETTTTTTTTTTATTSDHDDDDYVDDKTAQENMAALHALTNEFEQVQADVKDEAGNYLRSKHENKQLQQRFKQLQKLIAGAERKIEKQKQKQKAAKAKQHQQHQQQQEQPWTQIEAESSTSTRTQLPSVVDASSHEFNEDVNLLVGIFNTDESESCPPQEQEQPNSLPDQVEDAAQSLVHFPEDVFKNWTGKTPRQLLQEVCRKEKYPTPKYSFDRRRGCTVTIHDTNAGDDDPLLEATLAGPFRTSLSSKEVSTIAKEYVATRLLYILQPDRPLYYLLPPYFAGLWKEWKNEQRRDDLEAKEAVISKRSNRIQELMKSIEMAQTHVANIANTLGSTSAEGKDIKTTCQAIIEESNGSTVSDESTNVEEEERIRAMFEKRRKSLQYQEMFKERSSLPIYPLREDILQCVAENPVTVLCAETGAGKTTNVGQFILEDALQRGSRASILCTQPRRVAATSVAERVAEEMCEPSVGKLVGYQIRLESRKSAQTRLLFCTTGVVLRRLVEDPTLSTVTHILVDEVHERQWQVDVVLIALRKLLTGLRPDIKVVLMSATLDAELFCSFFGGAPLVSVPGRTFPVTSYYLEDLLEETGHIIEEDSMYALRDTRWKENQTQIWVTTRSGQQRKETHSLGLEVELSGDFEGYSLRTQSSLDRVNETIINYDLIEDVLRVLLVDTPSSRKVLLPPPGANFSSGSVLIFLPGLGEIKILTERLENSRIFRQKELFDIVPMHSSLSSSEQRRAFRVSPKGTAVRKIILATNIAETSVTIPDVVYVIDSGRVRELQNDKRTSTPKLMTTWCSRASTKQRSGRAGRLQPGICLKLFSTRTEQRVMKHLSEPELMRIPLEDVCLNILATGLTSRCNSFLSLAPQIPSTKSIEVALDRLVEVGAIVLLDTHESLTPLGRHLAQLPVDARLGKMLIYGSLFKCVDPISTIAACLSASKPLLASNMRESNQVKAAQSRFNHSCSDFLTLVNIYEAFLDADAAGSARKFCQQNYLNYNSLREVREAKSSFIELLCGIGFLQGNKVGYKGAGQRDHEKLRSSIYNVNGKNESLVDSVVFAGVYPNLGRLNISNPVKPPILLLHKSERLEIRSSSVNSKTLPTPLPSTWMAFDEKFGTGKHRVTVSTTCFVNPFSILLFSKKLMVRHLERKVIVDDWIELGIAAQTAILITHIRQQLDRLLTDFFKRQRHSTLSSSTRPSLISSPLSLNQSKETDRTVEAIAKLLTPATKT